jgi:hypothetical protein
MPELTTFARHAPITLGAKSVPGRADRLPFSGGSVSHSLKRLCRNRARLSVSQAEVGAENGSGRLNACPTILCKPLICRSGAGRFACVIPISQPFSAASETCILNFRILSRCEDSISWGVPTTGLGAGGTGQLSPRGGQEEIP